MYSFKEAKRVSVHADQSAFSSIHNQRPIGLTSSVAQPPRGLCNEEYHVGNHSDTGEM